MAGPMTATSKRSVTTAGPSIQSRIRTNHPQTNHQSQPATMPANRPNRTGQPTIPKPSEPSEPRIEFEQTEGTEANGWDAQLVDTYMCIHSAYVDIIQVTFYFSWLFSSFLFFSPFLFPLFAVFSCCCIFSAPSHTAFVLFLINNSTYPCTHDSCTRFQKHSIYTQTFTIPLLRILVIHYYYLLFSRTHTRYPLPSKSISSTYP